MNSSQSLLLSVPLGKDAHRWAEQFAAEQATPQKGKQVYLNTLAVYAVHSYLKWLPVETALSQGDSWHPGLRAIFDVADLVLPNIGKIECRPVLPGETALVLPPEVTEDRIGYVGVQFNQKLDQVQLLGFSPAIASLEPPEKIQVAELQSLDALIDNLTLPVKLRQWLEGVFREDWRSPNLVLAENLRLRKTPTLTHLELDPQSSSISRAKIIDLGRQEAPQAVVMLVQLTATSSEKVDILLRLYPGGDSIHLPLNLQLILLDEAGTACMEAIARSADKNWMQLEFSCTHEEGFSVKVVLGEMSITQQFVV